MTNLSKVIDANTNLYANHNIVLSFLIVNLSNKLHISMPGCLILVLVVATELDFSVMSLYFSLAKHSNEIIYHLTFKDASYRLIV